MNRMLKFKSVEGMGIGIMVHKVSAIVNASVGAIRKRAGEEVEGRTGSLINSLTPSANGWRTP